MVRKCIQCEEPFEITGAEVDYYKENGLEIPKRCRKCRQANRLEKNTIVIPNRKERGKMQKKVLGSVPTKVLLCLIAFAFLTIYFFRDGTQTATKPTPPPSNVEEAVMFRTKELWEEHYSKHGKEMGYGSAEEYLAGANATIQNSSAKHKKEKEDGDDIYYVESTNDLVIVSTDGYIRTYFRPDEGIRYYNKQ